MTDAAASRQADAAEASARAQAQAAHIEASARAQAAHIEASARAQAIKREASAREDLHRAQADAALDTLSGEQLAQLGTFKRTEEDRANLQALFDKLGNAYGCIALDGRDTEHFKQCAEKENDLLGRFHNLSLAVASLVDLREEIQRIRTWDVPQTREETLARIRDEVATAKKLQRGVATKGVVYFKEKRMFWRVHFLASLVISGCTMAYAESPGLELFAFLGGGLWVVLAGTFLSGFKYPDELEEAANS